MSKCKCTDETLRVIPSFAGFTAFTPTIPKMYWDVKSQEQRIFGLCKLLNKVICYADMLGDTAENHEERITELETLFEQFMESGFDDYYEKQIEQWIKDNLGFLFEHLAKQVFFGLTQDGHFVAYIPESWDDIIFDTGMVYGEDTYGRLMLRWDVDESGDNVNQRPENWQ